ncbi:MAG: hypothetical protein HYW15_02725 [Candidatus Giovannonibacteria bacterium]|nr:MAG: hypothetical protein HYW15_02725 [Candidatus Giovannonibacteria bacterium]
MKCEVAKEECDFVWLNAEACGPVDPMCHSKSLVILAYEHYEDHRCFSHAAYDLAETLCKQIGIPRTDVPTKAFKSLRFFFAAYILKKLHPLAIKTPRAS